LLGAAAVVVAYFVGAMVENWADGSGLVTGQAPHSELARMFEAFVLVGMCEELAKWAALVGVVYRWREFDEPMDGLLYSVAIALGFATLENFLFLHSRGLAIAWQRAVFAVPAHALFGGCMGFYVGRAKFARADATRAWQVGRALALSLLLPIGFHGAYDFALLHGLGWKVWAAVTLLSLLFWVFVLRRVRRARAASPFRPKTMLPADFRALRRETSDKNGC
jgi:RsiW-degrading membrane proteinase PrsW (M82 family)